MNNKHGQAMYIYLIYTGYNNITVSYETLHRDPGLDGVGVLYLLVLTGRHVPLLAQPEAVVQPGQEVQTVLHPGHIPQRTAENRLK